MRVDDEVGMRWGVPRRHHSAPMSARTIRTMTRSPTEPPGVAEEAVEFERGGDFRYVGQGYEVTVALPRADLRTDDEARVIAAP